MGDAWIGIQRARPIGQMHTGLEGSYTSPERWCERCGARLRQRNHGTLCAPCDEATWTPYVPPEPPTHRCQWCGRAYTRDHPNQLRYCGPTCRNCARKARERARKSGRTFEKPAMNPHGYTGRPQYENAQPPRTGTLET